MMRSIGVVWARSCSTLRDRLALIGGFLERKGVGEGLVFQLAGPQRRRLARGAARVQVEQLRRHIAHRVGGAARGARPLLGAQLVQRRALRAAAGIAVDQVQRMHRHVDAVTVGVFEHQKLARSPPISMTCRPR